MTNLIMNLTETTVLPFDPISKVPEAFVIDMTPPMARYILEYHNKDNRELKPSQVNKISQSVDTFGWLFDGQSCNFNTEGNITEKQHGLTHIARNPDDSATYKVAICLGVVLDSFSNAAPAKPRRPHDEIYRKDNTVQASQSAILSDLTQRRGNKPKYNINNAVKLWFDWKDDIKKASLLCDEFLTETDKFSGQTKTIGAWATLCVNAKLGEEVKIFLDLWQNEILGKSSTRLTSDFIQYWEDNTPYENNEGKLKVLYRMLCVAMDRILEKSNGEITFNMTPSKLHSKNLGGVYRKFLA